MLKINNCLKGKVKLKNPVLIEALPGIGLVGYLAGAYLIQEFNAEKIYEIITSNLPNLTFIEKGEIKYSFNALYKIHKANLNRDLMILFGNTQASPPLDQYKLYSEILDLTKQMGCKEVISIGGLKREKQPLQLNIYCTATNKEILMKASNLGAKILYGKVFGAAGVLPGLAKLKGLNGLCILVDSLGVYPDASAAQAALKFLSSYLNFPISIKKFEKSLEWAQSFLSSF
ncbi:PAC2 family protein [Candidatus Bathyarchaeota archaeon]|nr:PAC2 family protein [Candidatus Bathyarchaeota archaeon]